jgi:hypothetical protein
MLGTNIIGFEQLNRHRHWMKFTSADHIFNVKNKEILVLKQLGVTHTLGIDADIERIQQASGGGGPHFCDNPTRETQSVRDAQASHRHAIKQLSQQPESAGLRALSFPYHVAPGSSAARTVPSDGLADEDSAWSTPVPNSRKGSSFDFPATKCACPHTPPSLSPISISSSSPPTHHHNAVCATKCAHLNTPPTLSPISISTNSSPTPGLLSTGSLSSLTFSPSLALCRAEHPMQLSPPPSQMQPFQSLSHSRTPIFPTSTPIPEVVSSSSSSSSGSKKKATRPWHQYC